MNEDSETSWVSSSDGSDVEEAAARPKTGAEAKAAGESAPRSRRQASKTSAPSLSLGAKPKGRDNFVKMDKKVIHQSLAECLVMQSTWRTDAESEREESAGWQAKVPIQKQSRCKVGEKGPLSPQVSDMKL